jgi:uncharacterized SAM-binding protein YcdF (DUF218 family)
MRGFLAFALKTVGLLTLVLLLAGSAGLFWAGHWLPDTDAPTRARAIVVLGGSYSRPLFAADLYDKGWAPLVYVSRPRLDPQHAALAELGVRLQRQEDVYAQVLRAKGVPESAIRMLGSGNVSTWEEARKAREVFGPEFDGPGGPLLVVTSSYHVRRARRIFQQVMPGVEVRVLATPYEEFASRWWTDRDSTRNLILETAKILYYELGGNLLSRPEGTSDSQTPALHAGAS